VSLGNDPTWGRVRGPTLGGGLQVVRPIAKAADVLGEANARVELALENVALVEE
jgi:hypothetical protein